MGKLRGRGEVLAGLENVGIGAVLCIKGIESGSSAGLGGLGAEQMSRMAEGFCFVAFWKRACI